MTDISLQNEKLRLRAPELEDLQFIYDIENDPDNYEISDFTAPYSRYTLRKFLETFNKSFFEERQLRLVIEDVQTGKAVGLIDLFDYEPLHLRATIGIVIQKVSRRKKFSFMALTMLCNYAMQHLHIHSLHAYIPSNNKASLLLFTQARFSKTATLKDWIRTADGYQNVILMSRLEPY